MLRPDGPLLARLQTLPMFNQQGKANLFLLILANHLALDNKRHFLCLVRSTDTEKTLKSSGKCFIYGKLLRHTNKVSLRFLLRDALHEPFFTGHQEGNIVDNHS